jgi:hypothetical protein
MEGWKNTLTPKIKVTRHCEGGTTEAISLCENK